MVAQEDVLAAGTRLGRYEIEQRLATGGMAEIYLARMSGPAGFAKHVVLKRILPLHADNPDFVRMFHNEARYAATLDHPNIAHVYDLGEDRGLHYFTMEYLHGDDCRALIRAAISRRRPLPLEHAVGIVIGAAAGCHYAHEMADEDGRPLGLVHRDISPSNVVVTYAGAIKIVDFGIAKATARETETATGATKGKLSYMAPEQARGQGLDRRADVYALGVLLYELTTLRRAFVGEIDAQVLWQVMTGEWQRPTTLIPGYPPALEAILERAMAIDRDARYATARELQHALEAFAAQHELRTSPGGLGGLLESLLGARLEPWRTADGARARSPSSPTAAVAPPVREVGDDDGDRDLDPPSYVPVYEPAPAATGDAAPAAKVPEPAAKVREPAPTRTAPRPRPGTGRVPWIVLGVLTLGGLAAVSFVWWSSTRPQEAPVVVVADRGHVTVEAVDAAVAPLDAVTLTEAGAALDAAVPVDAAPRDARAPSSKPPAGDPLSAAFGRRAKDISACFAAHPPAAGAPPEIVVRFVIDAAGVPTEVTVAPPELARTPLGACIVGVGRSTRFGAQAAPVTFRIPLKVRS